MRGRPESLLLRGEDITAAQSWAERRKPDAPAITDAMRALIKVSRESEATQLAKTSAIQRRIILVQALLASALATIIVVLVGWVNQSYVAEQWRWWTIIRPYAAARVWPHVLTTPQEQALKPGDLFKECAQDCPEMILLPTGSFTMGSPATEPGHLSFESPLHTVTIAKPFAVSKFELTFADWDACVAGGGCGGYKPKDLGWGRGPQPVINVSWEDAQHYVGWLARLTGKPYRLLSEAEYEYAARAGTTTAYPWGDDVRLNGMVMANCGGCGSQWGGKQPAPVGSFPPNKFGLYDMVGNVWEWAADCVHYDFNDAPTDGLAWNVGGDCSKRVLRGGTWLGDAVVVRSAIRGRSNAGDRDGEAGFRVARTLDTR